MDIKITKKQKVGILIFLVIIIIITSIIYFKNKNSIPKDEFKKNRILVEETTKKADSLSLDKESKGIPGTSIKAYICGYVLNPGVYTLKEGDRLDDLVKLAGGVTKEADLEGVNLAYKIKDQDYLKILSTDEIKDKVPGVPESNNIVGSVNTNTENTIDSNKENNMININTAPKEQLKELPRIGDAMSQRIIDYREKEGGFKTIEDIKEVSGIGDKMFDNIKDKITVE